MKIQLTLSLLLGLTLFSACKNTTDVNYSDTGTLRGIVALIDASGDTLSNYSGITVQVEGTPFQTTTSANGLWEIDSLPAGIYDIIQTKPGFDTTIVPEFQFSGSGTAFLMYDTIEKIPMDSATYTIDFPQGDSTASAPVIITGTVSGPDSLRQVMLSFGPDSTRSKMEPGYLEGYLLPLGTNRSFSYNNNIVGNIFVNPATHSLYDTLYFRITAYGVNYTNLWYPLAHENNRPVDNAISPYSIVKQVIRR